MEMPYKVNLQLFGEGGGAAAGGGEGAGGEGTAAESPAMTGRQARRAASNPLANVRYGKQPEEAAAAQTVSEEPEKAEPQKDRNAQFEDMIKGEFKDLYDDRVQKAIKSRFKDVDDLRAQSKQLEALSPVLEMLSSKYGVDSKDMDGLIKAIQDDDAYYESEAIERGLDVKTLKEIKRLENENANFRRIADEEDRRRQTYEKYMAWEQQAERAKEIYPNLDLRTEMHDPKTGKLFAGLLNSGVDVKSAYQVIHMDEIIGGMTQYAATTAVQKAVNDIRARGMRPSENGSGGGSQAADIRKDPKRFTKDDRAEIYRRAMRGEKIRF